MKNVMKGYCPPTLMGHHPFSPPILVYKPFIWAKDRQLDFGISDKDEILLPPSSCFACTYDLHRPIPLSPSTATHHSMGKLTLWNQVKAFACHSTSEHGHAPMS